MEPVKSDAKIVSKKKKRVKIQPEMDINELDRTKRAKTSKSDTNTSTTPKSKSQKKKARAARKKAKKASSPKSPSREFSEDLKQYLISWQSREDGQWKFNKIIQAWALEHCMVKEKIDSKLFKMLLPYILTVKGAALKRLMESVEAVIESDGGYADADQGDEMKKASSPSKSQMNRAIKIKSAVSVLEVDQ